MPHTPAPWKVEAHEIGDTTRYFVMQGPDERSMVSICAMNSPCLMYNNAEADATLMAAAPDLLENARIVLEGFGKGLFVRNTDDDMNPGWAVKLLPYVGALARLEVAIKQATANDAVGQSADNPTLPRA